MVWQGVALLPFIDPKRLLDAMAGDYPNLTEDEVRRNKWGNNMLFVSDDHTLYPLFESLYGKRKNQDPVPIDHKLSKGITGSVLPNPECIPGSTYYSPLPAQDEPDIKNDRSLSALYFFPKQLTPHRSILLPGLKRPTRQLSWADTNVTQRFGDNSRGRGGYDQRGSGRGNPMYNNSSSYNSSDRGYSGPGSNTSYQQQPYQQRPSYQQGYGGYNPGGRPSPYGGQTYNSAPRGGPPGRGGPPNQYNSYGTRGGGYGSTNGSSRGDYSGYGGYGSGRGDTGRGGYSGYGGYGGQTANGQSGYGAGSGSYHHPRGRGRGGY